tara:strand:+ start:116 stop:439 length:324 start_codon:yes stop_codon:yes gene_type:complete
MVRNLRSGSGGPASGRAPSADSFWGIQVAAYKTRTGAKEGWSDLLKTHPVPELLDAKVQYFLSRPLKSGIRLNLVVLNSYDNFKDADGACKVLKEVGVDCVAVRINP